MQLAVRLAVAKHCLYIYYCRNITVDIVNYSTSETNNITIQWGTCSLIGIFPTTRVQLHWYWAGLHPRSTYTTMAAQTGAWLGETLLIGLPTDWLTDWKTLWTLLSGYTENRHRIRLQIIQLQGASMNYTELNHCGQMSAFPLVNENEGVERPISWKSRKEKLHI